MKRRKSSNPSSASYSRSTDHKKQNNKYSEVEEKGLQALYNTLASYISFPPYPY